MSDDGATLLAADAAARSQALDISRSILLQAPAGSGKTTVLVCRYLKLLAAVEQPEQILAITFTRKAAAEMRGRVLKALQAAARGEPDPITGPHALAALAHSAARHWQLIVNPARLRITTIDSVCHALVSANPVLSGGGAGASIAADARGLYDQAAESCLRQAMDEPQLRAALRLWLQRLDNQWPRLKELLADMLDRRSEWLPILLGDDTQHLATAVNRAAVHLVEAVLAHAMGLVPAPLLRTGCELARTAAPQVADQTPLTCAWQATDADVRASHADVLRWRWLAELLLTGAGKGNWRKKFEVRNGFPAEQKALKQRAIAWVADMREVPGALSLWQRIAQLPSLPLPAEDAAALDALAQLLVRAGMALHRVFAEQGQVDFSYIAGAARRTLVEGGEPTPVALRASSELRHVLVDEFQDTSRAQYGLVEALTLGWSAGDGRTVFMVGDPMQSIYQFRQAEVGNFLQVRDRGLGGLRLEYLQLRINFRSDSSLVAWFNERFARLFPPEDDLAASAIRFLPAVAAPAADADESRTAAEPELPPTVQLHALNGLPSLDAVAAAEAAEVVRIVKSAWQRRPSATIAVLISNRRHAAAIAESLADAGIAVRANRVTALADRAVVRDLLALARALQHPGDRIAWLALLRGPYCGLDVIELEQLAAGSRATLWSLLQDAARLAELPADAARRLQRLRDALEPAVGGAECRLPLSQRLHHAWLRLGGAALCRQSRDLADARACFAALSQRADLEMLSGAGFDRLLDDLYAAVEERPQQVDVLTMHGAKGLQWDVVIGASLGRQRAQDQQQLLRSFGVLRTDGGSDWLLAPMPDAAGASEGAIADWLRRLAGERQQLERVRLLYVLATRARRALHLFGHASRRSDGQWRPDSRSLLADAWPALAVEFTPPGDDGVADETVPATTDSSSTEDVARGTTARGVQRSRLPSTWQLQPRKLDVQRLPVPSPTLAERIEYSWVGQTARAIGTVVHAELQRLAQSAIFDAAAAAPAAACYLGWLAELGVPAGERNAAAADVLLALQRVQADERGRWLLNAEAHREAHSEVRLSGLYRGELVNISIDRMLVDAAGVRWVVDFKTNRHEGGALEEFIEREVQRYRPQLQRYAALAARLGPEPLRCALYFPLSGAFREVLV
jgi:ATP-dependent helicase/nuclease subunit A